MDPVNNASAEAAPQATALASSLGSADTTPSLLALLHWWQTTHRDAPLAMVALHPGPTPDDIRSLTPTTVIHDPQGWTIPRIAQRLRFQRAAGALTSLTLRHRLRIAHPVYLPDASGARLLHWLPDRTGPVTTHLPATSSGLAGLGPDDESVLLERTDRWIVGSHHHMDDLCRAGIDAETITELPDLLGPDEVDLPDKVTAAIEAVREHLLIKQAIPVDAPLVVGVGASDWWLEPDAFIRVCWEVVRRQGGEQVHLCWIADGATDKMLWPLRHDIAHSGLEQQVHVVTGARPSWQFIAAADLLIDTRLASVSAVGHTAAHRFAKSVITFAPRGNTDADGWVREVPHLDCTAMADAVLAGLQDQPGPGPIYHKLPAEDPRRPNVGGPLVRSIILGT